MSIQIVYDKLTLKTDTKSASLKWSDPESGSSTLDCGLDGSVSLTWDSKTIKIGGDEFDFQWKAGLDKAGRPFLTGTSTKTQQKVLEEISLDEDFKEKKKEESKVLDKSEDFELQPVPWPVIPPFSYIDGTVHEVEVSATAVCKKSDVEGRKAPAPKVVLTVAAKITLKPRVRTRKPEDEKDPEIPSNPSPWPSPSPVSEGVKVFTPVAVVGAGATGAAIGASGVLAGATGGLATGAAVSAAAALGVDIAAKGAMIGAAGGPAGVLVGAAVGTAVGTAAAVFAWTKFG